MSQNSWKIRCGTSLATSAHVVFVVSLVVLCFSLSCVTADTPAPAAAPAAAPIELLSLIYTTENTTRAQVAALWHGLNAALYHVDYKTASGQGIVIHQIDDADHGTDVVKVLQTALNAHPNILAAIGPFSDSRLGAIIQSPFAVQNNIVAFSPYTGSSTVRVYSRNAYFTRAEPNAELLVLLKAIINTQKAIRIGFMYLSGVLFGDAELATTRAQLRSMGRDEPVVYSVPYQQAFSQAAFDVFANQNLQAILIWGMPGEHVETFISHALSDPRTRNATLYASLGLQDAVIAAQDAVVSAGLVTTKEDHIFFSTTNALPSATEFNYIRVFQKEMRNYLANSPDSPDPSQPDAFLTDLALGELMVGSWLSGRVLLQALNNVHWTLNRSTFQDGLFHQNRYVVEGDYFMGNYGGECTSAFAKLDGAVCRCNQGGRATCLKALHADGTLSMILSTRFDYAATSCYSKAVKLPRPVNVLIMDFADDPLLHTSHERVMNFSSRTAAALNDQNLGISYNVFATLTTTHSVTEDIIAIKQDHQVDVLMGPVPFGSDLAENLLFDPVFVKPAMSFNDSMMVSLMPTMEQQIYIAYYFLRDGVDKGQLDINDVHVIFKGFSDGTVKKMQDVLGKTAQTLSMGIPSYAQINDSTSITSQFRATGGYFALGIAESDIHDIAVFLSKNPKVSVLITYPDLARYYTTFVREFSAFKDPTIWSRCSFMSSLPPWNDVSDGAHAQWPTLEKFHAVFPDPVDHTPRALQTFITTTLLAYLVSMTPRVNSTTLRTTLYQTRTFVVDDMHFGPFVDCSHSPSIPCEDRNYGATLIGVLSMWRVLDPTQPYDFPPMVPSMVYSVPVKEHSLSKAEIAGIAVGCVVAVAAIIAVVLIIVCCCFNNSRDNKNAPREVSDPVTLVFTDIESSTALWAACPTIMPDAVATHHKIIRQLIASYKCYEVKTIGDSFMIACKSPAAAVNLARDIQTKFLKYDWKTPEIDEAYHQFELNREAEAQEDVGKDGYHAHSAHLSPDVYEALWNGLRVRIGIHAGLSDIRQDEITKGFDYYGETSNMAARTEAIAHGGQIVATEGTWWALSQQERESVDCTPMGPQGLRGVPYAVQMYQLNAVIGRNYPPLRTEIEAYLPNDDSSHGGSSATDALLSSAGTLAGPAAAIAAVLTNCFSPYQPARRVKELQPLLEKWGVGIPPHNRHATDTDRAQGLINRLAVKMSSVAQVRQRLAGADAGLNSTALLGSKRGSGTFSATAGLQGRPPTQRGREAAGGLSSTSLADLDAKRTSVARRSLPAAPSQPLIMTSLLEESLTLVDEMTPSRSLGGRRPAPTRVTANPLSSTGYVNPRAWSPHRMSAPGAATQDDTIFVRMPSDLGA